MFRIRQSRARRDYVSGTRIPGLTAWKSALKNLRVRRLQ
jgi:hypothetical protein